MSKIAQAEQDIRVAKGLDEAPAEAAAETPTTINPADQPAADEPVADGGDGE